MAEAQYRINGGGLAFLDARSQRYAPFVSGGETGAALLSAILRERRLEFAFEMDRFFTLKDWANRWLEMQLKEIMLMELVQRVESTALTIPAGDFKWQLPIPQSQRDLSNLQQNPGY
jgi:hypothetical protein